MSIDTAISRTTLGTPPEHPVDPQAQAVGPNASVIAAIRNHHAQLTRQAHELTDAVLAAHPDGDHLRARDELHTWYRAELLPHAVAEEQALYLPASELDATRLLICGMLAEHRSLVRLVAALNEATGGVEVIAAAAAARAVFDVHVSKENDLLLPALDQAGLDLAAALDGMHAILGQPDAATAPAEAAPAEADCGCGCARGDGAAGQSSGVLQIGEAPRVDPAELDVRALPHGQRHEIIFARLDQLGRGQSLVIVNDHDPKPLRYQTSALWPDRFEWSYRQSGPEIWRVAIIRTD
ncbi:MAG: DUF2249 domain-containing protein [Jatrophihabitantaceae bacterium]